MSQRTAKQLRSGPKWHAEHKWFKAQCKASNEPCWKCHQPIPYDAEPRTPRSFTVEHALPIRDHPERVFQRSLYRACHYVCNSSWRTGPEPRPVLPEGFTGRWTQPNW